MFTSLKTAPWIAGAVLVAYLLGERWLARYAVLLALGAGVVAAAATSRLDVHLDRVELARPVLTAPDFSPAALIGIAVPLTLATLASQNAPAWRSSGRPARAEGPAADRFHGPGVHGAGPAFGSHAVNLAAITAAICTGPGAHRDPGRRYVAGVACGAFYLLVGAFGTTLVLFFAGLPKELVAAIAGVALFGALAGG